MRENNLKNVIAILNDGDYHDGTAIGAALKITRSAVWKVIKKLQNYGIAISCVKGRGYALSEPLIMLDADKIRGGLQQKGLQQKKVAVEIFESIDSTNDYLRKFYGSDKLRFCFAEHQTHGRGRFGRNWYSPFAQNLYFSLFYPCKKDVSELAGLSLVVGLAIVKSIRECFALHDIWIKWPNDIICANKKLAGILTDVHAEAHGASDVIIGVGIDVNLLHDNKPHDISAPWISLREVLNKYIDRNIFAAALINNLLSYLDDFNVKGFQGFMDEWGQCDYLAQKNITLKIGQRKINGQACGIDQHGHILLRTADGTVQSFSSGDVTLVE